MLAWFGGLRVKVSGFGKDSIGDAGGHAEDLRLLRAQTFVCGELYRECMRCLLAL